MNFFLVIGYVIEAVTESQDALVSPLALDAVLIFLPISAYISDVLIMQSRMVLPFLYGVPMLIVFAAFSVAAVILTAVNAFPGTTLRVTIGIQAGFLAADVVLLFLSIGLTRIQRCCHRKE